MSFEIKSFKANDGTEIYYYIRKTPEKPKAILQIVHGMLEYMGRYEKFADDMADAGFEVAGIDLRGHGLTGKEQGHLGHFADKDGWNKVLEDLVTFSDLMKTGSDLPYFILGHSMGSFLTRCLINKQKNYYRAAIVMGTGEVNKVSEIKALRRFTYLGGVRSSGKFIQKLLFNHYKKYFDTKSSPNVWIAKNAQAVKAYDEDKYCGFVASKGFFRDFADGMIYLNALEKDITADMPVLILSGGDDPVGDMGKNIKKVYEKYKAAGADVNYKIYEGLRHEILQEKERNQVVSDIINFYNIILSGQK